MSSIFSKNGILSGRIDYYCLICAEHFVDEDESLAHIVDAQHKENLNTCGYFDKYKADFIRKTKGIYFCEPCSLTFPTATKVELHIDEPSHVKEKNKISPWLVRVNNDIVVFNQYIISDDAWNGCVEDTCVLCNTEFEDSGSHKEIKSHILNLIKSEVTFDQDKKTVHRTIDAKTKQCLTCNVIIGNETSHFSTVEHKDAYKLYDPSIQKNETKNASVTCKSMEAVKETKNVKDSNNNNGVVKENIKLVNGNIGVINAENTENDVKKDTKKNTTKPLEKEATKPFEKVKEKPKQSPKKESFAELDKIYCKNLGAKDYVTESGPHTFCIICELLLVNETRETHLQSNHHQTLLQLHLERLAEKKTPSKDEGTTIPHESVDRYQKKNINIDFINEAAFCKKCSKSIDFNTSAIDKHIQEHEKTCTKKSPETLHSGIKSNGTEKTTLYTKPVLFNKDKRQESVSVEDYAKQHGFSHNRADNSFYCRPCSRRLPTTLNDLQKHVASNTHAENTKQSSKTETDTALVKEPVFAFMKNVEGLKIMDEEIIIINEKYWINTFNFFLIARKNEKIYCQCCYIDLTRENVLEHILLNDNHRHLIEKCLLITSLPDEFIREIKMDLYHCGYCNNCEEDWDDMLDHIATSEHKREKSKAEERLRGFPRNHYNRTRVEISEIIRNFVRNNCF